MKPGERITLIKKIAGRLGEEERDDIRLTLGQFNVSVDWQYLAYGTFDPFSTVVRSIEGSTDRTLLDLHAYLFGEGASPARSTRAASTASDIWATNAFRLFVSHTSENKKEVAFLRDLLRTLGVSAFVAHTDIDPTKEWVDVIESALDTCDALLAYLTPDFQSSKWTDQEIGFCVARSVLIVPVKMGLDPYGFIGKYQALRGIGRLPLDLAKAVVEIIVAHPLTSAQMAAPTAVTFADSYSFDNARDNLERLKKIPSSAWTPELIALVREALTTNSQIEEGVALTNKGSTPIPVIVGTMLDKIEAMS